MVQVKISEGLIEGEVLEGSLGGSYYSFKGIPYAEPPIGDLRFKVSIFYIKLVWFKISLVIIHCISKFWYKM